MIPLQPEMDYIQTTWLSTLLNTTQGSTVESIIEFIIMSLELRRGADPHAMYGDPQPLPTTQKSLKMQTDNGALIMDNVALITTDARSCAYLPNMSTPGVPGGLAAPREGCGILDLGALHYSG